MRKNKIKNVIESINPNPNAPLEMWERPLLNWWINDKGNHVCKVPDGIKGIESGYYTIFPRKGKYGISSPSKYWKKRHATVADAKSYLYDRLGIEEE